MKSSLLRGAVEVGFIVFLFYANLLMGEYERSGLGQTRGLGAALEDVLTATNLGIAVFAGLAGHVVVELLRRKVP